MSTALACLLEATAPVHVGKVNIKVHIKEHLDVHL